MKKKDRWYMLGRGKKRKTDGGRLYAEEPKMDVIESSEFSKEDDEVVDKNIYLHSVENMLPW